MKCAKFLGTLSNFTVKRSFFLSPLSVQAMKHDSDYKISNGSKAKHESKRLYLHKTLRAEHKIRFAPLWFEPRSCNMWESQVLLTDGQVAFQYIDQIKCQILPV